MIGLGKRLAETSPSGRENAVEGFFRLKIGLLGPYGFGNLGDAAIQQAVIENIHKHCPGAEIHGFSLNPDDTRRRHGIPCFPFSIDRTGENFDGLIGKVPTKLRLHVACRLVVALCKEILLVARSIRYLRGFDLLIVSGGGQLDDYWGGAAHHPLTLLRWALVAKAVGARVLFMSVGAGPIDSNLSKRFIKLALSLARYRSYRDEASKKLIVAIGFRSDDPVYPDLAFSLRSLGTSVPTCQISSRPLIGIGPMTYFDPRIWPERDQSVYAAYLSKLAQFSVWLIRRGYPIALFPGELVHDRLVIDDLRDILSRELNATELSNITDKPIVTVDQLMDQLLLADIVIASRFHGVLLALLVGKPVLALSYHSKIDLLMEDTGQSEYCLPIHSFDIEMLKQLFCKLEANAPTIGEQLKSRVGEYRSTLEEQYVRVFKGD